MDGFGSHQFLFYLQFYSYLDTAHFGFVFCCFVWVILHYEKVDIFNFVWAKSSKLRNFVSALNKLKNTVKKLFCSFQRLCLLFVASDAPQPHPPRHQPPLLPPLPPPIHSFQDWEVWGMKLENFRVLSPALSNMGF